MSDLNQNPQGDPAPDATPVPSATATPSPLSSATAAPPTTPPADDQHGDSVTMPKAALTARLQREREASERALMAELGITDKAAIKALIDADRQRADAQKTLEQRAAEQAQALKAEQDRAARLLAAVQARADSEMSSLTSDQQKAVVGVAGDDPAARLRAIDALKPTWIQQAPTQVATPAPVQASPVVPSAAPTPPASTAPAPSAPGTGVPVGEIDHRGRYEELRRVNPFAAAQYGEQYVTSVYKS
jgi:hypothetical protein